MRPSYFLKTGDIIDIVAPGSACSKDIFEQAVAWIKQQGFIPRYPKNMLEPDIFISNSDELRLKFLVEALTNTESKAVWCLRGGYGALRLVPELLKIKQIKQKKIFIGYSDVTTIHLWLNQKMNWLTIHGPLLERCGQRDFSDKNKNELLELVSGQQKEIIFKNLKPVNLAAQKIKQKTKFILNKKIYGGNLTVFCSSLGTDLAKKIKIKKTEEFFLFFEEIGERGYRIDRMLCQLEQSKALNKCRAIFLGDFLLGDEADGQNHIWTVIQHFFKDSKIPVFSGLQAGHGQIQRPVILNSKASLTCGNDIRLLTSFE